eukprot:scaffold1590_cov417-Prasinococcus_capsulatus_cf.AAC.5
MQRSLLLAPDEHTTGATCRLMCRPRRVLRRRVAGLWLPKAAPVPATSTRAHVLQLKARLVRTKPAARTRVLEDGACPPTRTVACGHAPRTSTAVGISPSLSPPGLQELPRAVLLSQRLVRVRAAVRSATCACTHSPERARAVRPTRPAHISRCRG